MRILILSTFDTLGGAAIAGMRLHKALLKSGQQSIMLVQKKKSNEKNVTEISSNWIQRKISFFRFAIDRFQFFFYEKNSAVRFLFSQATIGIDISRNQYVNEADIIHIHWINFGFLSISSLEKIILTRKPIIITMHDMWFFTGGCHYSKECNNYERQCGNCTFYLNNSSDNDLSHKCWKRKQQMLQNSNITFVACSQWLASVAQKSSLLKSKQIFSIPNPIDIKIFESTRKDLAQKYFNLSSDKIYILFAAMKVTDERKGFIFFRKALEQLALTHPEIQNELELIILGQVEMKDFESIPFKVNCLGRLSEITTIAKAYAAAHIFVIPSIEDNLPNTVMESLACGTPVVGFNTGGIPEMIEHKRIGYIAEYKSSDDLARGIYWTLFESDYQSLCIHSREKAVKCYSEEIISEKYNQVYRSAIFSH